MLQSTVKPWWEWLVYVLGVIGGTKTLIWDWILCPYWRRPKIRGSIEKWIFPPLSGESTPSKSEGAEVGLYIWSYNKRPQHTYLKKWMLKIRTEDRKVYDLEPTPSAEWQIPTHFRFVTPMPDWARFAWREPVHGWVFFRCRGLQCEILKSAVFTLFAVDVDGRKHKLFSGRPDIKG
jgi:hypothetical protein